ncbi:MAG: bacteriohemerythrin [Desulfobacteraceae bacterium]|nr:bacteriohemerythrin [Desulfobacteraceae bacterium]
MALLAWKEEYSVKIREIDEQHKKLVALINELNDAMSQGQAKAALENILGRLVSYAATHFANEERLMQTHGYPGFPEHKEKHEKMTAKVLSLQQEYRQGKMSLSIDVMSFLKNWLDKHILGTDMAYSGFLISKGVK